MERQRHIIKTDPKAKIDTLLIFDDIIKASQDLDLTAEDGSVLKRESSNWRLEEQVLDLQTSPYARRSRPPGVTHGDDE